MKEAIHITLCLKRDKGNFSFFSPLLQQGFLIKTQVGSSIKNLLCEQFKVAEDYLEERIATIFLDGKPVDDVETAVVKDSSTVALGAAAPGLVGATLRKGGILAGFRSSITHQEEGTTAVPHEKGMVKIKLFNLVIRELGPLFLKEGIWLQKQNAEYILKDRFDTLRSFILCADKDGQEIDQDQLAALNWSEESENVFLRAALLV